MLLGLIALSFVATGLIGGGAWLIVSWLGFSFSVLFFAQLSKRPRALGKRPTGEIPIWNKLLHLPYYLVTELIWRIWRKANRAKPYQAVTPELLIGRRLLADEAPEGFANYVDLTAEFDEPRTIRSRSGYASFPILDAWIPDAETLRNFIQTLKPGRTFVHCAQGHGRTGLFAAALLLQRGVSRDPSEALKLIQTARPGVRLNSRQRAFLDEFADQLRRRESATNCP